MRLQYSLKTALSGILLHKKRSLLTILGIIIGISSIMVIMGIGQSANDLVIGEIQAIGSNTLVLVPGKEPSGPSDFASFLQDSIKEKDIEALKNKNNVPGLKDLSPHVFVVGNIHYGNEAANATVIGSADIVADILGVQPDVGVFFSQDSISLKESVIVIGKNIREELFGSQNPIGQKVKVKNRNFRVIGLLPDSGASVFANVDDLAFIPYTTAQLYLTGTDHFNEVIIRVEDDANIDRTVRDIEATMREQHDIDNPEDDDFRVQSQEDIIETVGIVTDILTAVLSAVAAISLVVGGIGIMNMMLVTVTERTKEVGLRKAVGAKEEDILQQFLWESILLTGVGGVIGILLGLIFSYIIAVILTVAVGVSWDFSVPVVAVILGIGSSVLVGVVFGIYPARKAARKNPIEALRYE